MMETIDTAFMALWNRGLPGRLVAVTIVSVIVGILLSIPLVALVYAAAAYL